MTVEHKLVVSGTRLLARELESGKVYMYVDLVKRMSGRMSKDNVAQSLLRLAKEGIVENVSRGVWLCK